MDILSSLHFNVLFCYHCHCLFFREEVWYVGNTGDICNQKDLGSNPYYYLFIKVILSKLLINLWDLVVLPIKMGMIIIVTSYVI